MVKRYPLLLVRALLNQLRGAGGDAYGVQWNPGNIVDYTLRRQGEGESRGRKIASGECCTADIAYKCASVAKSQLVIIGVGIRECRKQSERR